jgi:hypothetical protein
MEGDEEVEYTWVTGWIIWREKSPAVGLHTLVRVGLIQPVSIHCFQHGERGKYDLVCLISEVGTLSVIELWL